MRTADLMERALENAATQAFDPAAMRHPSAEARETALPLTHQDVETVLIYLARTRDKAEAIRERAPAGSYLDKVLEKTIDGIVREMAQLRYLLAHPDVPLPAHLLDAARPKRMRPAL